MDYINSFLYLNKLDMTGPYWGFCYFNWDELCIQNIYSNSYNYFYNKIFQIQYYFNI